MPGGKRGECSQSSLPTTPESDSRNKLRNCVISNISLIIFFPPLGLVAPQNTFLENIVRRFNSMRKYQVFYLLVRRRHLLQSFVAKAFADESFT